MNILQHIDSSVSYYACDFISAYTARLCRLWALIAATHGQYYVIEAFLLIGVSDMIFVVDS